jgi:hypothetical protein
MRASKAIGAVFALSLGGAAVFALSHGLDQQVEIQEPCKDKRLSYADQNACATESQAAANKEARNDVYDRYIAKAAAVESIPTDVGPAPTKIVMPHAKAPAKPRSM